MRTINNIVKKSSIILMTIILLTMQDVIVRYRHAHYLNNGTIVWHAHPFGDSNGSQGGKNHHHSPGNQFALDQIAQSLPFSSVETTLSRLYSVRLNRFKNQREQQKPIKPFSTVQLRAPPMAA